MGIEESEEHEESKYRGVRAMPFVIGNETFEKLGTLGTASNLLVYLTSVFNMKSITATNLVNIFNGTINLATLVGAFLCDTYFGRYKTLGFASISSFLGMLVLTLTAAISKLHPPQCRPGETENCPGPNTWQMLFLLSGFGFLVIGGGGIRPCNLAFGADQFNPNTSSGKRGISSFFNWVGVAAIRKRKLKLPSGPSLGLFNHIQKSSINAQLPHTDQFRSLDKAAIITPDDKFNEDGSGASPWRLCSIQQVEEVKCLVRTLPIWTTSIIYYVTLVQQQTYTIFQALQMDRRLGPSFKIPAASYTVFSMVALTIWIPIYDQILVPALRKITGKEGGITVLQKMGIGVFLAIVTMSVSGFVEGQRRSLALKNPIGVDPIRGSISSLSGLWLVPQLVLGGLSEAFTVIAQVEFNYKQFPENMRSIGGSLLFVGFAVSSYLSSLLISIIHHTTKGNKTEWLPQDLNKGRLDYFYYLVAALEVVNLGYFIICARWYKYKGSSEGRIIEEVNVEKVQTGKELTL
ncbi:protein NRT1/ PTR FAMILY 2.9-like isoform X2 [Punica granatum]|uniref:Protein NRT1/ PTR FAMILY 2.9-like isoform X2 n=1 Tax=Punica granatum TaxID=22663 RepID=A0A6P8BQC0_PUNGR|nr:protein NRT1/ PTR FAMILY 2.9-like isoform X2 [Punica granatum]